MRSRVSWAGLLFAGPLLLLGASALGAEVRGTVMVLDLRSDGFPKNEAAAITTEIASILAKRSELRVLTMADVRDLLSAEKTKQLFGCNSDHECAARISDAVAAERIVSGTIGRVARRFVLSLVLIDGGKAETIARSADTFDQFSDIQEKLPELVARLFGFASSTPAAPRFQLPEGQKLSFAVLDLMPVGTSTASAETLTQIVSVEIKRIEGTSVISKPDLMAMLAKDKLRQALGAECDTSCIAELGGALGVDKLVFGSVGKLAGSYVISLSVIDPVHVVVDNRVTESFEGREEELIRAVRAATRALLGVHPEEDGTLAVSSAEGDAELYVDSARIGTLPMAPRSSVAGRHAVRIAKDGFYDWHDEIYVDPGETTAVYAELMAKPEKWYEKWWVWAIAGGVAAAGGTTLILITQKDSPTSFGTVH